MNGEKDLEKSSNSEIEDIKSYMAKVDNLLDDYTSTVGINYGSFIHENDTNRFLNLGIIEMNRLSAEDLLQGAYLISQYALYIQKEIGRENAHLSYAKNLLDLEVAKYSNNYKGYSYTERCMQAIKENSYLDKLYKVTRWAKARIDRLEWTPKQLIDLSDKLKSLAYAKQKNYNNNNNSGGD